MVGLHVVLKNLNCLILIQFQWSAETWRGKVVRMKLWMSLLHLLVSENSHVNVFLCVLSEVMLELSWSCHGFPLLGRQIIRLGKSQGILYHYLWLLIYFMIWLWWRFFNRKISIGTDCNCDAWKIYLYRDLCLSPNYVLALSVSVWILRRPLVRDHLFLLLKWRIQSHLIQARSKFGIYPTYQLIRLNCYSEFLD